MDVTGCVHEPNSASHMSRLLAAATALTAGMMSHISAGLRNLAVYPSVIYTCSLAAFCPLH